MAEPATLRSPTRKNRVLRAIAKGGGSLSRLISDRGWIGIWGTVEHVGRKSGTKYRTPVAVLSSGDLLIVPVPFGGATQWVQNVLAAGGCGIRWKGHDTPVTEARLADWAEVRLLAPRVVRPIIRLAGIRTFLVATR
jgi:deazaflavin-dependent oxidoreductase (nitroreductase family)